MFCLTQLIPTKYHPTSQYAPIFPINSDLPDKDLPRRHGMVNILLN